MSFYFLCLIDIYIVAWIFKKFENSISLAEKNQTKNQNSLCKMTIKANLKNVVCTKIKLKIIKLTLLQPMYNIF